ncbi:unannotated protein [freshwater metagenome]|uniref:Unannotated protein n=1 Tax=freshwater metagenome TaxID=449393 RepID=A0A6J7HNS4_9ZZZZ
MDLRPAGAQRRPVRRLELVVDRTIDDVAQQLAGVERHLEVGGDDPQQRLGLTVREGHAGGRDARARAALAPVQTPHDVPADAQRVELVLGQEIREPRDPGVHLRAPELLVVGLLARRHPHQRRSAEEHLGGTLHEDGVVAHPGDIGAAGGRVPEDDRDGRDPHRGELGEVAEHPPPGDEDVELRRQVCAAGLHEVDQREAVLAGDLSDPQHLPQGVRVRRPAPHRGVVREHGALDPLDGPDPGHHARADDELRSPRHERLQLQERRVLVQQQLDPLAGQELTPRVVALDVPVAPSAAHLVEDRLQCGQALPHRVEVVREYSAGGVD